MEFVVEGFGGGVGFEFRVFFEEGRICWFGVEFFFCENYGYYLEC